MPTPVSDGELLYVVDDKGLLTTWELASGDKVYGPERLQQGTQSGSPLLAGKRIYVTNEDGETTIFSTGRELEILGRGWVDGYVLASMAAVDGLLLVRSDQALWAVAEATESAPGG